MVLNMYICQNVVQFRNMINPCKGHALQQYVLSAKKLFLILYINSFMKSMIRNLTCLHFNLIAIA